MSHPPTIPGSRYVAELVHLRDHTIPQARRLAGLDTWGCPLADRVRDLLREVSRTVCAAIEEAEWASSGTIPND